jgi:NDP-sugar pyrophosphorylase family protein
VPVVTVIEPEPLGTGGALRLAVAAVADPSDPVLVLNGDTWLDVDFAAFLADHRRGGRIVSLLCVEVDDVSRYGRIERGPDGGLIRFVEKDPAQTGPGLINGGAVLFSRAALERLAAGSGPSLERDFLAGLPDGAVLAHVAPGAGFIDIGTPESLSRAGAVLPGDHS